MSRIVVTPLSQLATQLASHQPSHVVTLGSEAPAALPDGYDAVRLSLTFNDIIELREGLVAPDETHVRGSRFSWDRPPAICLLKTMMAFVRS